MIKENEKNIIYKYVDEKYFDQEKIIKLDLCQYFGHKKLNIFSLHDINT